MRILAAIYLSILSLQIMPQALPIYIDGTFNDWDNAVYTQSDDQGDGSNLIDFISFKVANDNDFLFIKIEFTSEVDLSDNNEIYLDIDADNDASTGWQINGIGSEMDWNFGQKYGYFTINGSYEYIYFSDIKLRLLPTVTSNTFEIAIGRNAAPNGTDHLFTGDTIKISFYDSEINGDKIPNEGYYFTYVFDNTDVPAPESILLPKEDSMTIRLMTYNIQNDFENNIGGLDDTERIPSLIRIFNATKPEIVTLNECWNTTVYTAQNFFNENLPLNNNFGWFASKIDGSNITISSYPILQTWMVHTGRRISANLIDLPNTYATDILVLNAHLKCCDGDNLRQLECDAIASFLLDAKTTGGVIDLPPNTPFILMGDLNLVGFSQQLKTLLEGDIQDTVYFGLPAKPDWDNTNLEDLISRQSDKRMAYTWREDYSSYPPGRLDFMIYSESAMQVQKAFTLQTEVMSEERLLANGLELMDTRTSSDHFPKVADFSIPQIAGNTSIKHSGFIRIFPNPVKNVLSINTSLKIKEILLYDSLGKKLKDFQSGKKQTILNLSDLQSGVYFIKIVTSDDEIFTQKLLIN